MAGKAGNRTPGALSNVVGAGGGGGASPSAEQSRLEAPPAYPPVRSLLQRVHPLPVIGAHVPAGGREAGPSKSKPENIREAQAPAAGALPSPHSLEKLPLSLG